MERSWKVFATTMAGSVMVYVDTSILNVAFRDLAKDYGVSKTRQLTWVFSAYSIAFAAALLTAGRAGDRIGRKRAFLGGVAAFSLASVLCAISPNVPMLIVCRILQAIAGAFVVPNGAALFMPEFPPEKRSAAIGISGAIGGLTGAFGPLIGGVLVDAFGWRSVFLINVPVSIVAIIFGSRILKESKDPTAQSFPDPLGGILAIFGVGLLTATIVEGDNWGYRSSKTIVAVVVSLGALAGFVWRSFHHKVPVVDLSLFKLRFFTAANISSFLFSAAFFAMFFTNISFLQQVMGFGPTRSGFASFPGPLVAAIVAAPAGNAAARRGHKSVISLGLAVFAAGVTLICLFAEPGGNYWTTFFPAYLIAGFGVGLTISTLGSASNAFLPAQRLGMGSAINSTGRQVGAGMGIATVGALRLAATKANIMVGYQRSWIFVIVAGILACITMLTLFQRPTSDQIEASR
jgi:EmrB/QacA subfamily drug resistance transporter